jgi:hypothetical protein
MEPNVGWSFEGPALSLECVALLKADPTRFTETIRSRPPDSRRACVNQLLRSLTLEPEFTAADFRKATAKGSFLPDSPELSRRMGGRVGVNLNVAKALAELGSGGLIDDPSAVPPLIQCLNHPWLAVSRRCEDTLVAITRHGYGWTFYYDQPPPPTEEGRQRFVADWMEWEQQMQSGHPLFDKWLASECLKTVHQIGEGLTGVLKGTVASSYIQNFQNPRLAGYGGEFSESIFEFGVGLGVAANWPPGTNIDWVGIKVFRPGISNPSSIRSKCRPISNTLTLRDPATPENLYRESFTALDLEIDVEIDTHDDTLRHASFLAVKKALDGLRGANKSAAAKR